MPDPTADPFGPKKPDWAHWSRVSQTRLWCAVALACDIEPSYFGWHEQSNSRWKPFPPQMSELLDMAKNNIGTNGILRPMERREGGLDECEVDLSNFAAWLNAIEHTVPAGFPWTPETPKFTNLHWPWGQHSTKLLRNLAEAADRFWKNYDPDDPSSAPTNQQVTKWLVEQKVPIRTAEVMATILRVDGLPTSPRR